MQWGEKVMAIVNNKGYVERRDGRQVVSTPSDKRSLWLVKPLASHGIINLKSLNLPKHYVGKRVRVKVEVDDKYEQLSFGDDDLHHLFNNILNDANFKFKNKEKEYNGLWKDMPVFQIRERLLDEITKWQFDEQHEYENCIDIINYALMLAKRLKVKQDEIQKEQLAFDRRS